MSESAVLVDQSVMVAVTVTLVFLSVSVYVYFFPDSQAVMVWASPVAVPSLSVSFTLMSEIMAR